MTYTPHTFADGDEFGPDEANNIGDGVDEALAATENLSVDQEGSRLRIVNDYVFITDPASVEAGQNGILWDHGSSAGATNQGMVVSTGSGNHYLSFMGDGVLIIDDVTFYPVPPGGTTGQVLRKASNANGDLEWHTP